MNSYKCVISRLNSWSVFKSLLITPDTRMIKALLLPSKMHKMYCLLSQEDYKYIEYDKVYINYFIRVYLSIIEYNNYIWEPKRNDSQNPPEERRKRKGQVMESFIEKSSVQFIFKDDFIALWCCSFSYKRVCACTYTQTHTHTHTIMKMKAAEINMIKKR